MSAKHLVLFILTLLTIALIVGLALLQAWQTSFDARVYATLTAVH